MPHQENLNPDQAKYDSTQADSMTRFVHDQLASQRRLEMTEEMVRDLIAQIKDHAQDETQVEAGLKILREWLLMDAETFKSLYLRS